MPPRGLNQRAMWAYLYAVSVVCLTGCGTIRAQDVDREVRPLTKSIESFDKVALGRGCMGTGIIERDTRAGTAHFTIDKVMLNTAAVGESLAYDLKLRVETERGYREVQSRLDDLKQVDIGIAVFYRFHIPAGANSFILTNYGLSGQDERQPVDLDWFIWLNSQGEPIKVSVYKKNGDLLVRLKDGATRSHADSGG